MDAEVVSQSINSNVPSAARHVIGYLASESLGNPGTSPRNMRVCVVVVSSITRQWYLWVQGQYHV